MPNVKNYIFENLNYVDLTLYQYGIEDCVPMHMYGPVKRNHFLLHYVLKGKGCLQMPNGKTYMIKEKQAFLIVRAIPTTYYADSADPWSYIWIEFDGLKAEDCLKEAGLNESYPIYSPAFQADIDGLEQRLFYLLDHPKETDICIMGNLYLILDLLIKNSANRKSKRVGNLKEFYVREAINYIEQNYYREISVEDIAQWCNLNRSYFSKLFKNNMSVSPQTFLLEYRIKKACDLLSKTTNPIGEIAAAVGYQNQLHFSRAFKNQIGMPPRDFRLSHKEVIS